MVDEPELWLAGDFRGVAEERMQNQSAHDDSTRMAGRALPNSPSRAYKPRYCFTDCYRLAVGYARRADPVYGGLLLMKP